MDHAWPLFGDNMRQVLGRSTRDIKHLLSPAPMVRPRHNRGTAFQNGIARIVRKTAPEEAALNRAGILQCSHDKDILARRHHVKVPSGLQANLLQREHGFLRRQCGYRCADLCAQRVSHVPVP